MRRDLMQRAHAACDAIDQLWAEYDSGRRPTADQLRAAFGARERALLRLTQMEVSAVYVERARRGTQRPMGAQ